MARDDEDDALIAWSRGMPQPEPERRERRAEKLTDAESARWWQNYIDGKIAKANAARDEYWREVLGKLVSEARKQLSAAVGSLRLDIEIEKANAEKHSAEIARLDLRLMALIGELNMRQIESAERVFQLPRGAQRFTHGVNGNA
jgi:hypothetical protein